MRTRIGLLAALLLFVQPASPPAADVSGLLARCRVVKTNPTTLGSVGGYGTMNQCLLLGNGNLMVSVAGGPEAIMLFLGKTDFWRDRGHGKGGTLWQSGNVLPGRLNLAFPEMKDAKFEQVQDLALAEVRTTLTQGGDIIEVRSVTPHEADNFSTRQSPPARRRMPSKRRSISSSATTTPTISTGWPGTSIS